MLGFPSSDSYRTEHDLVHFEIRKPQSSRRTETVTLMDGKANPVCNAEIHESQNRVLRAANLYLASSSAFRALHQPHPRQV